MGRALDTRRKATAQGTASVKVAVLGLTGAARGLGHAQSELTKCSNN